MTSGGVPDAQHRMALATLDVARGMFVDNVDGLTLDEALDAGGGLRSILGLMKHTAAWAVVYRSYAFDATPRSWTAIDWPAGLRSRIDPTEEYVRAVRRWFDDAADEWMRAIESAPDLDEPRPIHWGETWPLRDIVGYVAAHWAYHAGEINLILAVRRGEAWEYGEHVEENHISTVGHSVRRPWITDEYVEEVEREMRQAASEGPADG